MENPICLITGATDGVGKSTSFEILRKGFTVVLTARNAKKAERLETELVPASWPTSLSDARSAAMQSTLPLPTASNRHKSGN